MNPETVQLIDGLLRVAQIVLAVGTAGFLVIAWFARGAIVSRNEHGDLEKRVIRLEERRLPGWTAIDDLRNDIAAMKVTVAETKTKVDGLSDRFDDIEEYIHQRGGRP